LREREREKLRNGEDEKWREGEVEKILPTDDADETQMYTDKNPNYELAITNYESITNYELAITKENWRS
jgi:hypothetical protein